MRLLLVCHEFPPLAGGASGAAAALAHEFAVLGHHVMVLTSAFEGLPCTEEREGYAVERVPALRTRIEGGGVAHFAAFALRAGLRTTTLADEFGPDAALAFFGLPGGAAAWRLSRARGVPYVLSLRGGDVPGQQAGQLSGWHRLAAPVLRRVWRGAAAVTANGAGLAARARAFEPGLEVEVISNGVDTERFAPSSERGEEGALRLVFCGRLSPEKDLSTLCEAVARAGEGMHLDVAGDGELMPWLRRRAARPDLSGRVRIRGFVPRKNMPDVYAGAHALVHPSRCEGLSNVVLEAMASGLPAVVADTPGSMELVRHGQSGLIVPAGDVHTLAETLRTLDCDRAALAAMGREARSDAVKRASWGAAARRYLRLLEAARGPGD